MDGAPGRGDASTECLPRKLGVAAGLIGSRPSQYRQAQHKIYSSRWNSSGVFIAVLHLPWPHTLLRHAQAQPTQSQESSICGRLPRQDTSQVSVLSAIRRPTTPDRSEEHTSELQSLMRISYAVFCLKKKKQNHITHINITQIYNRITAQR